MVQLVICTGTACYILGGSELLLIEEALPPQLRSRVQISGAPCLGHCRNPAHPDDSTGQAARPGSPGQQSTAGGATAGRHAPCVVLDGRVHTAVSLADVVNLVKEACHALEQ